MIHKITSHMKRILPLPRLLTLLSSYPRRGAIVDWCLLVTDYMDMGTGYHRPAGGAGQAARPGHCSAGQAMVSGVTLRHSYLTAISGYDNETSQPFSSIRFNVTFIYLPYCKML